MAADVDKRIPQELAENVTPPADQHGADAGVPSHRGARRSCITRLLWTLMVVAVVPVLAFGIKYYQDRLLLKRHVR